MKPSLPCPPAVDSVLQGIGLKLLAGADWPTALSDPRWATLAVFLHCERDRMGESDDDVDGIYLTREEAECAARASPQTGNCYVWKVFVSEVELGSLARNRKAHPHLARIVKTQLAALPADDLPGTSIELRNPLGGKAFLDAAGQRVVLFEDELGAVGGSVFDSSPQSGVFQTREGRGVFDETGRVLVPPRFEEVESFHNDLAAAKENGRWGFLNRDGGWEIPPQFLEVECFFDEDKAKARTDQGWGVIDRRGRWLVPPAWETLEFGPRHSFRVTHDGSCGYIDATGRCVAAFQPEAYWLGEYTTFDPPPEAFVLHHPDSHVKAFALADRQARRLTDFDFVYLDEPSEGLMLAEVEKDGKRRSGYIDIEGNWVILPRFEDAQAFNEGRAAVREGEKSGYIDRQGDWLQIDAKGK